jgi:outer membrane protein TolC
MRMKKIMLLILLFSGSEIIAQSLSKMPDSVRRVVDDYNMVSKSKGSKNGIKTTLSSDDEIKELLMSLALKNPEIRVAISNINIAEAAKKKAKTSILSAVNIGGNINEFVVSNPQAAAFFPKYNLGLNFSLDLFARNKAAKKTADEMVLIAKAQKEQVENNIKARVLMRYEIYKEEKTLLQFKKIALDDVNANYEKAQRDFKNEAITLDELNKMYKLSLEEKEHLVSKEKDFNIAVIMLEELIGVKLKTILE